MVKEGTEKSPYKKVVIPSKVWINIKIDDKTFWVYQQTGANIELSISLVSPETLMDDDTSFQHRNIFERE